MVDSNDDLTVAARVKQWEIFAPDWDYLRQYSTLQLGSLCALSVGLHPAFAVPSWVFLIAKPHFSGEDPDELHLLYDDPEADEAAADAKVAEAMAAEAAAEARAAEGMPPKVAEAAAKAADTARATKASATKARVAKARVGAERAALLGDFLRRVEIAAAELAPRGTLPIADGPADGERTVVRVTDFVSWADRRGWSLPPEFPRGSVEATDEKPVTQEGLQTGGAKWPWGNHETELLRQLEAAAKRYWANYDPSEIDTARTNNEVTEWLMARNVSKRTAEIMAQILRLDGLRTGPRKGPRK